MNPQTLLKPIMANIIESAVFFAISAILDSYPPRRKNRHNKKNRRRNTSRKQRRQTRY